jgi:Spy/CpxP family protein refolding chaperone
MQRSKQQALAFLLGAVLVGGVLGFSADRVLGREKFATNFGPRNKFFDDLGLSQAQRATLDSLSSARECEISAMLKPLKPQLDSIRASFRAQTRQVFTPTQLARLEEREKEIKARRAAREGQEKTNKCPGN